MDKNKFLNYFIYTAFTTVYSLTSLFIPVFLMGLGHDGNRIGILLMIFTVTTLLSSFSIGLLEDRFGARGNTIVSLILMAGYYIGLTAARRFALLIPVFFIGGLGYNIIRVTMNALFLKCHDTDRQGREIGYFNFMYQIFMGFGIIGGSMLLSRFNFTFLLLASSLLIALLIFSARMLTASTLAITPLSHYARDLSRKQVILFSTVLFLFYLHWGAEVACYAPFLKTCLRLTTTQAGLFMGLPIIFLALCTYYFGFKHDRGVSTIHLAMTAIICSGGGLILFAASHLTLVSFSFRLVHELGDAAFVIFTFVGIASLFPRERIGGTSGSMYVVMVGAQSAGSWLFSWLGSEFGYILPYLVAGLCSLSSIPLILSARHQYRFGDKPGIQT